MVATDLLIWLLLILAMAFGMGYLRRWRLGRKLVDLLGAAALLAAPITCIAGSNWRQAGQGLPHFFLCLAVLASWLSSLAVARIAFGVTPMRRRPTGPRADSRPRVPQWPERRCPDCGGEGSISGRVPLLKLPTERRCPRCGGTGILP